MWTEGARLEPFIVLSVLRKEHEMTDHLFFAAKARGGVLLRLRLFRHSPTPLARRGLLGFVKGMASDFEEIDEANLLQGQTVFLGDVAASPLVLIAMGRFTHKFNEVAVLDQKRQDFVIIFSNRDGRPIGTPISKEEAVPIEFTPN